MAYIRKTFLGTAVAIGMLAAPFPAAADIVTANCTGMLNLDIYEFETTLPEQNVEGIGPVQFSMDEAQILLAGKFGEYRFDLKAGTLYQNNSDTGLYCTYSTTKGQAPS